MNERKRGRFRGRKFITVVTALSFTGVAFTGVILFIKPPGRIANWGGWDLLGLTKPQWESLHISLSLTLATAALFHIYLNWKPLKSYFKNKQIRRFSIRPEWVLAVLFCAGIVAGTLTDITPFSTLREWQASIKHGWEDRNQRPPIAHAELMTLKELAEETEIELDIMSSNLATRKIVVDSPEATIADIAKAHDMTPLGLYNIAMGDTFRGRGRGQGRGQGRGGCGENPNSTNSGCKGESNTTSSGCKVESSSEGSGCAGGEHGDQDIKATCPESTSSSCADAENHDNTVNEGSKGRGGGQGGRGMGRMTLEQYCSEEGLELEKAISQLRTAGLDAKAAMTLREIADSGSRGTHPRDLRSLLEN